MAVMVEIDMHVRLHAGSEPFEADTLNSSYHGAPVGHRRNCDEADYYMQIAAARTCAGAATTRTSKARADALE
jgi:hypothetical protein